MNRFALVSAALSVLIGSPFASAQAPGKGNLTQTLSRLNAASAHFHSATASFHKEQYTSPIPDPDIQNGTTYVVRDGGHVRMGAVIVGAEAQTVSYENGVVRIYKPGLCYNEYSGKNNQNRIESFLTLGFGGSGTDLQKSWVIQDQGEETLTSDGRPVQVEKLLLTPREQSVKDVVKTITLWIDTEHDIALKQTLISPNDDRQTAVYTNIRPNAPIDFSRYAIPNKPCSAGGR